MNEIERCKPWIEAALGHSGDTHTFEDIEAGIMTGRFQLWPGKTGCMVTEILVYPQRKVLNIFLAGGNLEQLFDMTNDMRRWAIAQDCDGAMLTGRKGWTRVLKSKGWSEKWTTMMMEFD